MHCASWPILPQTIPPTARSCRFATSPNGRELSQKYLESIFSLLSRAGFVTAVRGKGGGYRLSRAPEEYTAAQIVSLGDDLAPVACLGRNAAECLRKDGCVTLPLWQLLNRRIQKTLEEVTLADLLSGDIPTE